MDTPQLRLLRLGLRGRDVTHDVIAEITGAHRITVTTTLNGSGAKGGPQADRILRTVSLILAIPVEEFLTDRERHLLRITRELDRPTKVDASASVAA